MIEYPEEYYECSNRQSEDFSDLGEGMPGSGTPHGAAGRTITKMFTQELQKIADRDPLHDITEQVSIISRKILADIMKIKIKILSILSRRKI